MNNSYENFVKKIENHDLAILPYTNNKAKNRALVCYFFSRLAYSYEIYRLENKTDLSNNEFVFDKKQLSPSDINSYEDNKEDDKSILIISDFRDRGLLKQNLFRAKVEYLLEDAVFLPKLNNSSYIQSLQNDYNYVMKYYSPSGSLMYLAGLRHYASQEEYYSIPLDVDVKRFVELYKTIAVPFEKKYENLLDKSNDDFHNNNDKNKLLSCKFNNENTGLPRHQKIACNDSLGKEPVPNLYSELLNNLCGILKSETGIDFVQCPAGSFIMGSPTDEIGRIDEYGHEEKQIEVLFDKPFFIAQYLMVNIQYKYLADDDLLKKIDIKKYDIRSANLDPVIDISYKDALSFCDLLNKKYADLLPSNYKFSLPTESQWEYACRAGTTTAFNNGKNLSASSEDSEKMVEEIAWSVNCNIYKHTVGLKKTNNWGLYDMHGNICEWCINDRKRKDINDKEYDAIGKGGSCFMQSVSCCRSAAWLGFFGEEVQYPYVGFRLALIPYL